MPHQKSKTTKAKAKSWKSQQLSASVSAHNRHTNTHTHTCSIGRTLFPGFALCQQNCYKNHRTTGKKKAEGGTAEKKIIFTFTMTMSLCLRLPATPPLSIAGTLMVCEQCQINSEERERGRVGREQRGERTKCLVVGGAWGIIGFWLGIMFLIDKLE